MQRGLSCALLALLRLFESQRARRPAAVTLHAGKRDLGKEFDAAAHQAGVELAGRTGRLPAECSGRWTLGRDMTVHFAATPVQVDRFLRALHAEILSRARLVGVLSENEC